MTATLPPPVADIKHRINELSEQDRMLLDEVLRVERENDADGPPWPWALLDQRKQALEQGRSRAISLEELSSRLKTRLKTRS